MIAVAGPRPLPRRGRSPRALAAVLLATLVAAGLPLVVTPRAVADTAPPAGTPATVTADALPTWQIDGVVWSQAVAGTTVYATGSFAHARPPGAGAGSPSEIPQANLIAYDITTGNRVATFDHNLNAQGLVVATSPDGTRVYVGGDFTTVDGVARNHIAAFDTRTGQLVASFAPSVDGQVRAIAATDTTVYVGGAFASANGVARGRLAAFSAATGALSTTWTPTASDGYVYSLVVAPGATKLVVGGQFLTLNGASVYGWSAIDATTGANLPWAANAVIRNYGKGAIASLHSDGTSIYGTGWAFGSGGTFEGSFSVNPADGSINWIVDCLGDTYDEYPTPTVSYSVSHSHNCSNIGAFPDTSPRVRWQRAMAVTNQGTQTIASKDAYGWDFRGKQAPTVLQWFPDLTITSYTGQYQAAWSVTGTGKYVALGGEFWKVNGVKQQGLTRFATADVAPRRSAPLFDTLPARTLSTTATVGAAGSVRVAFDSAWDRDNRTLTYSLLRDGAPTGVTTTLDTTFWSVPRTVLVDPAPPAGPHTWSVLVTDPDGNTLTGPSSAAVDASAATTGYGATVLRDGPSSYWKLGSPSGNLDPDLAGRRDLVAGTGVTWGVAGATPDPDPAVTFSGTSTGTASATGPAPAPDTFTIEAWFKTTTARGGKIVGYGNSATGASTSYDRMVYMDNSGRLNFGISATASQVLTTPTAYNDGAWHLVTASMDASGIRLSVDGLLVKRTAAVTKGAAYTGQWSIGGDTVAGWPNAPLSPYFAGSIDDVAIYPVALSTSTVQAHVAASGRTVAVPAAPADAYGRAVLASSPSLAWRLAETTGTVAADQSPNGETGTYVGYAARGQAGILTGGSSLTGNGLAPAVASTYSTLLPAESTSEVWFKASSSASAGALLSFGTASSGTSASIERSLQLTSACTLRFSVAGGTAAVQSSRTYCDGQWHQAVASQSAAGITLYADGLAVGTQTAPAATSLVGYWRVGGDKAWPTGTGYFRGSLAEPSVFPRALSAAEVRGHYVASGRTPANSAPVAAFTLTPTLRSVSVDASATTDLDGLSGLTYAWTFGDGSTATGVTASHAYAALGSYVVTLTVTDPARATSTVTRSVVVANTPPTAAFTSSSVDRQLTLDGSTSADPDGTLVSYAWDFGDGTTGSGATAGHLYAQDGSYVVRLTVTDNDGASTSTTSTVTVRTNQPPTAVATATSADLTATLDGTASSDPDGTVAAWAWDFGDGTTGTGSTVSHAYAVAGTYVVTLTVTDDKGKTGTTTVSVPVSVNQPPVASASVVSPSDLTVTGDATASSDPDGTVVGYAWSFGDGTSATGATTTHLYTLPGTYVVTLTVTDNRGKTATTSSTVTVAGPWARDTFARTLSPGWGAADLGGAWTTTGSASPFSVANGAGRIGLLTAGAGPSVYLRSVSQTSSDVLVTASVDTAPTGGGVQVLVTGRGSRADGYHAKVVVASTGVMSLQLVRSVAGADTVLATKALATPFATGASYVVRLSTDGTSPTTLRAKVWAATGTEPAAWLVSATDTTASLQVPGAVGLGGYLSASSTSTPTTISFSGLQVRTSTP